MPRILVVFFSFLFLIPQGLRANGTLTTVVMSNQTPDNACTQPPSVTSFSPTDQVAWLWFLVTNVSVGDDYSVAFYTPAGANYTSAGYDWGTETAPGNWCYAIGMDIAGYAPATMPGTWNAYIYNKSSQIYRESFTIAGSTTTCTYSLSSSSASVAASGGSGSFSVTLGSGCTASVSSDSWITFTISGTTVNYTVAANTSTSSRVGHITVGPQGSSVGAQTFTVTQAGASGGGGSTTSNVIQNGDAESTPPGPATDAAQATIPGWNTDGQIAVTSYAGSAGDLSPTTPGPANRGNNYFAGGPNNASSKMTQSVDLSSYAAAIDAGTQPYTLDGWLGGFSTQNDNAAVTVTFENASGGSLGTATIGPALSADRGGVSELVERSTSGNIPAGTRKMLVTVTFTRTDGAYNDGALDNLSFVLGSGGSTATGTSITITNPGFETIPSNPAWINCAGNGGPGTGGAGCQDTLNGIVAGWTASNTTSIGLFQPGPNLFTVPMPTAEGLTAAQVTGTLSQVLSATLQVSTLYTLQVDVGRRLDNLYPSPPPTVQLFAGSTLIASATGAQPPLGGWTTWTGTYQSSASDSLAGQPLKIVLGATAPQGNFDNVRLTAALAGGAACTYSLSPSGASPGATQTTGSITVTAGTGCAWTATSNATSWITITSGASGSGNGTVSYTVAANTGTTSRTGTITVGGQTFTVTQAAAAACSYSITPSTNTMGAQGGSGSFVVTTGSTCSWTASVSSSATWLHLGSTTSGTGGGTVGYSADVNTSTASRTGTITVGGQTFTLTEAGGASATAPGINQGGIVNAVSNQAGGGIAQGSMFSIYGTNLGPTTGWTAYQFPIPDTVNNVIVNVTAGSTTLRAYLLFVRADQINAIMPSTTPLGTVQVTVSYNGVVSAAAPVTIVKTSVGINSSAYGSGPGIIKNYISATNQPYNTASTPAQPNQVEIIVGTGLGAISTPDNQSPPGGAPTTPVQVVIGGIQAGVSYSGRAPGNAGQDQINFTVPSNVPLGCSVPLQVSAGGTWSNTVRIAISSDGSHCQDSFNPLAGVSTTGGKIGTLGLIRVNFSGQLDPTSSSSTTATLDLGFGTFTKTNPGTDFTYSPIANLPPPGTCASTSKANLDLSAVMGNASSLDPTIAAALDAGAQLTVTGGAGGATGTMTQELGATGPYVGVFGGVLNVSGVTMPPPFLDGGPFTISGTGGKDVGPFKTTVALAPAITWTNPPSTINRSSPLTLNWTGGSSSQTVMILGGSSDQNSGASGGFLCIAPAGAHSFTVPVNSLITLVPTGGATSSSGPIGFLSLMPMNFGSTQNFTAPGLDLGVIFDSTMTAQTVQVQ